MTWLRGAFAASLSSGAIVSLPPWMTATILQPFAPIRAIGQLLLILLVATPFGFAASILPNLAGSYALAKLGCRHVAARHPLVWLATGAALGTVIGLAIDIASVDAPASAVSVFAPIGLICAGISRWFTRWNDCAIGDSNGT